MKTQKKTLNEEHEESSIKLQRPRQLSILNLLYASPHAVDKNDKNVEDKINLTTPRRNGKAKSDTENIQKQIPKTPSTLRTKKVHHATSNRSIKKTVKKETSPITKKLKTVTENLIKTNQFQSDTPSKSFKIYCSKNENDNDDEEEELSDDENPWTRKQANRPREELPEKYKGSNISFDDDPFANEPMLSIEKRLAGLDGAGSYVKDKSVKAMTFDGLIKNLKKKK